MWQQRVFVTWPPVGSPSPRFRWCRRRLFYNKTHRPTSEPGRHTAHQTQELRGKGHTAGGQARSCRCETLLVSAGLLGPGGFPAGLSAPSRDWVGPARPQRQHGPGAQLTSGRREGREGDERQGRRTGWLSLLNGMNGQYFRCGCCLTRGVAHQLHSSKPVVLCY